MSANRLAHSRKCCCGRILLGVFSYFRCKIWRHILARRRSFRYMRNEISRLSRLVFEIWCGTDRQTTDATVCEPNKYRATMAVRRGHTVQPPSEWDRQMDGQSDGSRRCFMPPPYRAGHNKTHSNGFRLERPHSLRTLYQHSFSRDWLWPYDLDLLNDLT